MATIAHFQPTNQVIGNDNFSYNNNPKLVYVQQAGGMLVASQAPLQQPTVNNGGQVVYVTRGQQAMAVPSNTLQGASLQPVLPQAAQAGPRPLLQQQQQQAQNLVYVNINGSLKPAVIQNGSIYLLPEAPAQPQQVQVAAQPTMGGQLYMQQQPPQQQQQQQQQQVFTVQGGNTMQQQVLVQLPQQQQPQMAQQHQQLVAVPRTMVLTQAPQQPQQRVMAPAQPMMVTSNPPGLALANGAQGHAEPVWITTSSAAGAPQLVRLPAAQGPPPHQQQQQQQQFQQSTVLLQTTGALAGPVMPILSAAPPRPVQLQQLQPLQQLQVGVPSSGAPTAAGAVDGLTPQQLLMHPMVLGKPGGAAGGPATFQISASAAGSTQPGMLALSEGMLQPMMAQQQPVNGEYGQGLGSMAPAASAAMPPAGAPTTRTEQQQQQTAYLSNLLGIGNGAANLPGGSPNKANASAAQSAGFSVAGMDTRRVSDAPPATSMALLLGGLNSAGADTPGSSAGLVWAPTGACADASGGFLGGTQVLAVGGGSSLQERLQGLLAEEALKAGVTLEGLQLPVGSGGPAAAAPGAPVGSRGADPVVGGPGGNIGTLEGGNAFNAFGFSFFSGALSEAPAGAANGGPSPPLGGGGGGLGALLSGLRLGG